jgi:glycosyltransferase involved in cell wall biosynthesis
MRITHVVRSDSFAGVERYISVISCELSHRGHDVTVLGGEPSRMRAELPPEVTWSPATTTFGAALALAVRGRQDIVHAHMTAAELAAITSAPAHRGQVISTRHFAGPRGSNILARTLGHLLHRKIARQVAISRFVADAIKEPAIVLHNGVRSQPDTVIPRERFVLLLQRLEKEKATDVALRAWAASGLDRQGWELHIAGSGAMRDSLEQTSSRLGIETSVRWLGHLVDTREKLRRAGLLVATAPAEPFGLSIAEAMALATPVIASAGGAHPELLGPDAWTFTPDDPEELAETLRRAITLPDDEVAAYGMRLRERQRMTFDLSSHVDALEALYSEVATS